MCVRLRKGDFDSVHKVSRDPVESAREFAAAGASHLHIVDLDGARDGVRKNREIVLAVAKAFGGFAEIGGGVRDMQTIEDYLHNGLSRVIIGSAALNNPAFLKQAAEKYGSRLSVGIDVKNGFVSHSGWTETSDADYLEFAISCKDAGVGNIIFTNIERDGMLTGPDLDSLEKLQKTVGCDITASGGVRDLGDIKKLLDLGVYGVICGKSVYAGTLDLKEAIRLTEENL